VCFLQCLQYLLTDNFGVVALLSDVKKFVALHSGQTNATVITPHFFFAIIYIRNTNKIFE
jgi:hypothetical protein